MLKVLLLLSVVLLTGCRSTPAPTNGVPSLWSDYWGFKEDAPAVWAYVCEGGKPDPQRLLDVEFSLGSAHDGDREYATAYTLLQFPVDPHDALAAMLQSPDPYARAFAALVIGNLGDRRFYATISRLLTDNTPVPTWDWHTVSWAAYKAIHTMHRRDDLMERKYSALAAPWLQAARRIKTGFDPKTTVAPPMPIAIREEADPPPDTADQTPGQ